MENLSALKITRRAFGAVDFEAVDFFLAKKAVTKNVSWCCDNEINSEELDALFLELCSRKNAEYRTNSFIYKFENESAVESVYTTVSVSLECFGE